MESWSYVSGVKNFASDESVSGTHVISRTRNGLSSWGLKPSSSFRIGSSSVQSSDHDVTKSQELNELGSLDMMSSLANGSIRDVVSLKFGSGRIHSQLPAPLSSAYGEEESSSKLSSSIVESNRDSPLIDLKLGRFPDHKDAKIKANANFSQAESSMPAKKPRAGSLSSQRPHCQVHGCRKDLSSSKDYHKRHKVCEIHSKTTKVIVNGIEQRFCQQCSRFHLLAAFDAGKRSCRKRLAGHNERRRKPPIGIHEGRAGRVYQSYNCTRFEGTSAVLSSFVCQDIFPSSLLQPEKYELNNWSKNSKVEDRADCGPEPAIPKPKGQTCSNSFLSSFGSDKQRSPLHEGGFSVMTRIDMNQKNHACMHNVSPSDFVSHPVFHNTTIGSEDFIVLKSSSSVAQELPAASSYGRALSLLSSQSQNSLIPSSRIPAGVPIITPSYHAHYSITQVSEKLMRVGSQTSTTGVPNSFRSSGINSSETQIGPILISDGRNSVNYGMAGIIPGSEYMNAKNQLFCEDGSTIDLLQLSSQLHRVEHQRQSKKVEEENDAFFDLRIS